MEEQELTVQQVFDNYEEIINERDAKIAELERLIDSRNTIYQNPATNKQEGAVGDLMFRGKIQIDTNGVWSDEELPSINYLNNVFNSDYTELKDSMLTFDYGNILIEHHELRDNQWEESSLLKSKSEHWMFHFKPFMLIVEKEFLDWLYQSPEGYISDYNKYFVPTDQTIKGQCMRIGLHELQFLGTKYNEYKKNLNPLIE